MTSRGDLLKALRKKAINPNEVIVGKMIEYFSVQLPFMTPDGLVKLYNRAGKIPNTFTRFLTFTVNSPVDLTLILVVNC